MKVLVNANGNYARQLATMLIGAFVRRAWSLLEPMINKIFDLTNFFRVRIFIVYSRVPTAINVSKLLYRWVVTTQSMAYAVNKGTWLTQRLYHHQFHIKLTLLFLKEIYNLYN